jgi:hypothetical protein
MLFHEYAGYRLAVAEHEERLQQAARARLAALAVASRPSAAPTPRAGPALAARNLIEAIRSFTFGRRRNATSVFKRAG